MRGLPHHIFELGRVFLPKAKRKSRLPAVLQFLVRMKNGAGDEIRTHDFNLGNRETAAFASFTVIASGNPECAVGRRLTELASFGDFGF